MNPWTYLRRVRALYDRGLSYTLWRDVRDAANVGLLRDIEALSDRQLTELNAAHRRRKGNRP